MSHSSLAKRKSMDDCFTYEYDDEDDDELEFIFQLNFPRRCKIVRTRPDHFNLWRDYEFFNRFRLQKCTVKFVISLIREQIASQTTRNHAVSPEEKVLLTLRYYATGSFIAVCGDFVGVHKSTAGKIIKQVSEALATLRSQFISFPSSVDERKEVRQEFFNIAKLPRCIGAIDCTHIRIRSPGGNEAEIYRNRKNFFSLNVQTVCDANLRIQNIVARWPGSTHDLTIFNNSSLKQRFEIGEFHNDVLVGDSGYAVQKYLITPLLNPGTDVEQLFNESLIRTRNTVERSYGVWKRRFPVLSIGMNINVSGVQAVIVATAVLHNIATHFGERIPRVNTDVENEIRLTTCNALPLAGGNRSVHRVPYLHYFSTLLEHERNS